MHRTKLRTETHRLHRCLRWGVALLLSASTITACAEPHPQGAREPTAQRHDEETAPTPQPTLETHGITAIFGQTTSIARPAMAEYPTTPPDRERIRGQGRIVVEGGDVYVEALFTRGPPERLQLPRDEGQTLLNELAALRDAITLPPGVAPGGPGAHSFPHAIFEGVCPLEGLARCAVHPYVLSPDTGPGVHRTFNDALNALLARVVEEAERVP